MNIDRKIINKCLLKKISFKSVASSTNYANGEFELYYLNKLIAYLSFLPSPKIHSTTGDWLAITQSSFLNDWRDVLAKMTFLGTEAHASIVISNDTLKALYWEWKASEELEVVTDTVTYTTTTYPNWSTNNGSYIIQHKKP